jgi:molybdopterin molybdotransferase
MLTVEQALAEVLKALPRMGHERVPLANAVGRVLGETVAARHALPPWDNSAMDGFAVRAEDLAGATASSPVELPIVGTVAAGHPAAQPLESRQSMRIMTGAPMPTGADSVVMKEDVTLVPATGAAGSGGRVRFVASTERGRHVRRAGEDVAALASVLEPGTDLGPGEVGVCAAVGQASVVCVRRPRVAILSTGDELCEPGQPLGPGQIYSSNAWALAGAVTAAGGVPTILPTAPDDEQALEAAVRDGLTADLLLSTGGVSVGDFDLVRQTFERCGVSLGFWQVAMRPGKPLAFGRAPSGTPVFGLPGNPVSALVSFELFARPALRTMLGAREGIQRPRAEVVTSWAITLGPRRHFVRTRLTREGLALHASPFPRQGSHELRSLLGVHALLDVPAQEAVSEPSGPQELPAGTTLSAILLALV